MDRLATQFADWVWVRAHGHVRRTLIVVMMVLWFVGIMPTMLVVNSLWFGFGPSALIAGMTFFIYSGLLLGFWKSSTFEPLEQWAAGNRQDPQRSFESTFAVRRSIERLNARLIPPVALLTLIPAGIIAFDLTPVGIAAWVVFNLLTPVLMAFVVGSAVDFLLRPARLEMAAALGDTAELSNKDSLRRRVTGVGLGLFVPAAMLSGSMTSPFDDSSSMLAAAVAALLLTLGSTGLLFFGVLAVGPLLEPVNDLTAAVDRVATGDYGTPVPLLSDDALGELVASVNSMQAGLAERERLQSAFGSYVDPALAARLLDQGDEIFRGERLGVTVMFVDVRDFTPFAEANSAEDTVTLLNDLFEVVVPISLASGGHVNKYLGDGAMVVFGAPEPVADHADRAVAAAIEMQQRVHDQFGEDLRIGIGINTGAVIAGTIGGGGKLEFTLIGDTVNVAARVEQLTKRTADSILVTQATADALSSRAVELTDRGVHQLKGKSADVRLHAVDRFRVPG